MKEESDEATRPRKSVARKFRTAGAKTFGRRGRNAGTNVLRG